MTRVQKLASCLKKHWWLVLVALGVIAFTAWAIWSAIELVHARDERVQAGREGRTYICNKVNEVPDKIAKVIRISGELQAMTGVTTTTISLAELSPEAQERVRAKQVELQEAVRALGEKADCSVAALGSTATTTP